MRVLPHFIQRNFVLNAFQKFHEYEIVLARADLPTGAATPRSFQELVQGEIARSWPYHRARHGGKNTAVFDTGGEAVSLRADTSHSLETPRCHQQAREIS